MFVPLTVAIVVLATVLFVAAVYYAIRDKLVDDRLLAVAALLELGLVVQLVVGLVGLGHIEDSTERATFVAYLVSLPLIPISTNGYLIVRDPKVKLGFEVQSGFAYWRLDKAVIA